MKLPKAFRTEKELDNLIKRIEEERQEFDRLSVKDFVISSFSGYRYFEDYTSDSGAFKIFSESNPTLDNSVREYVRSNYGCGSIEIIKFDSSRTLEKYSADIESFIDSENDNRKKGFVQYRTSAATKGPFLVVAYIDLFKTEVDQNLIKLYKDRFGFEEL